MPSFWWFFLLFMSLFNFTFWFYCCTLILRTTSDWCSFCGLGRGRGVTRRPQQRNVFCVMPLSKTHTSNKSNVTRQQQQPTIGEGLTAVRRRWWNNETVDGPAGAQRSSVCMRSNMPQRVAVVDGWVSGWVVGALTEMTTRSTRSILL